MTTTIAQAWQSAKQTGANANCRVHGTVKMIRDGEWIYAQDQYRRLAQWWAYNLETGERVATGHNLMTDVTRFMCERHLTQGGNQGYVVTGGPGKAVHRGRMITRQYRAK